MTTRSQPDSYFRVIVGNEHNEAINYSWRSSYDDAYKQYSMWKKTHPGNIIQLQEFTCHETIHKYVPKSIAVPALGCGYGNLPWYDVKPLIITALDDLDCDVMLYEPQESWR